MKSTGNFGVIFNYCVVVVLNYNSCHANTNLKFYECTKVYY